MFKVVFQILVLFDDYIGEIICGVDEVGCGLLVGLVFVVVVIFDLVCLVKGLCDFKKFFEVVCDSLVLEIKELVLVWVIVFCNEQEIDEFNILYVSMLVMCCVVEVFFMLFMLVLIDGNCCLVMSICFEVIVKGDDKVLVILVVFIFVKIVCDVVLLVLYDVYLYYGFDCYKGYLILLYLEMLCLYGVLLVYCCFYVLVKVLLFGQMVVMV